MANEYPFTESVKREARLRQDGKCAGCGRRLDNLYEHAHHVVPQQSGRTVRDPWLETTDNCVVLCDACHTAYHGHGSFRTVTAEPKVFKHSHGINQAAHQMWLGRVTPKFDAMGR